MSKLKVTSFDVAERAGVSRATVSMVLNRAPGAQISEETRQRVFLAADDLGYRPNSAARMLVSGNTETIALILSDSRILLSDAFVPQLLYGISSANREHGYHVLFDGMETDGAPTTFGRLVESRRIDGMIVLNPQTGDQELQQLVERNFPVVLIGSIRHPKEHSVNFSTRQGITAATHHLVELGHSRFGMIPFSQPGLIATDVRVAMLRNALRGHGLSMDDDAVEYGEFSSQSGFEAARRLRERRPDITAIFAGNDTIAVGALSALNGMGVSVPDDVSIVGFDDLPFARYLDPPLTTIRTDGVDTGRKAAQLLFRMLRGETIDEPQLQSPTEFVVRASTGVARG